MGKEGLVIRAELVRDYDGLQSGAIQKAIDE